MRRWLGWFALAVIVGMQAGSVFRLAADGSLFPQFSELGWI